MNFRRCVPVAVLLVLAAAVAGCTAARAAIDAKSPTTDGEAAAIEQDPPAAQVVYENERYGVRVTLPDSWRGFRVITETWEAIALDGPQAGTVVATGPRIVIRHPAWSAERPRQDLPILVFTHAQWDEVQAGRLGLGAAPVGPSQLGRNNRYVLALPARYNYAFPEGHEEVTAILEGGAVQAFDVPAPGTPDAP
ncbi:MAG TPA: hypothetical protein VIL95_07370 [Bacillota bacterium]